MADSLPLAMPSMSQRPRPGARVGMICGAILFSVWSLLILGGVVEVVVQASGVVKVAHVYLAGGSERRMTEDEKWESGYSWDDDDRWDDHHVQPASDANLVLLDLVIRLVTFVFIMLVELATCFIYYSCYIKPTYTKFIPKNAIIPQDLQGRFKHDIFDCTGDCGTFCCFIWCQACTMSDLWYRVGWIHVSFEKTQVNCDGWQWFAGICGFCMIGAMAEGCFPCIFAALRNGVGFLDGGDGGFGEIIPLKKLFGIPTSTCGEFYNDCCCHFWCGPCIGTQEYRQVMEVLARGPPEVRQQTVPGMVVGNAVVVGAPVQQAQPKM